MEVPASNSMEEVAKLGGVTGELAPSHAGGALTMENIKALFQSNYLLDI
jgi:hypothetical protein